MINAIGIAKAKRTKKQFEQLRDCLMATPVTEGEAFPGAAATESDTEQTSGGERNKMCLNECCHKALARVTNNTSSYPELFCSNRCEQDKVRNMLQALSVCQCMELQQRAGTRLMKVEDVVRLDYFFRVG